MGCLVLKLPPNVRRLKFLMLHRVRTFLIVTDARFHGTWTSSNVSFMYILTYAMVQSPSWEANWFAASQEISCISQNPEVHYRTHKRPPSVSILGQPNPVHIPTSHLLEIHPNIIHPSTPRSPLPSHISQNKKPHIARCTCVFTQPSVIKMCDVGSDALNM